MWLLKAIGGPGSIGFLAIGCAAGLALAALGPRSRALGRVWLLLLYGSYAVAGIPEVAHAIGRRLPACPTLPLEAVRDADTLIVLAGDNARGRLAEARRLLAAMPAASVIVSGDAWIADRMLEEGLARERLTHDSRSATTREQVLNLAPVIRRSSRTVLVASRLQIPRVSALTTAERLPVLLAPAPLDIEPPETGWRSFVPRYSGLRLTRDALYEHLALAYYSRHGWIETRTEAGP